MIATLANNSSVSSRQTMEAARHSSILATTTYEQTNTTSEANKFAALNINLPEEYKKHYSSL